ncbi:MAG TPA: hypothetical protein VJN71_08290 [Nitrososphaerales archaeon]|nr:hypothetical protein [Nitrososphaerales archaeon]
MKGNCTIEVTRFTQNGDYADYLNYTDLELYYSLDMLQAGQYSTPVNAFENANGYWNGYGFADVVCNSSIRVLFVFL